MRPIKTISVIGQGKLGKPISDVLARKFKVIRIDKKDNFKFDELGDISFVVVPTPSTKDYSFTSYHIEDVLSRIKHKQVVVIVSTVMPGETDRLQLKYPLLTLTKTAP